jgi:uncharacterized membrane protein YjdF
MIAPGTAIAGTTRRHPGPMATMGAALAAFGVLSAIRGDPRFWAFVIVIALLAWIVSAVEARGGFSRALAWSITALGVLHLCGGLLPPIDGPTFYETWLIDGVLKFDQAVHFYGSVVSTLFAWEVLARYLDPSTTTAYNHAMLAAGFALGKGALNEVIEFLLSANLNIIYAGSSLNTEWDLVFNTAGVMAAAMYLRMTRLARATTFVQPDS